MPDLKTIGEDEWITTYRPKPAPIQGSGFDYGEGCTLIDPSNPDNAALLEATDPGLIWTVLDSDDATVIASGMHFVNRLGHIITEVPCGNDMIEVEIED